MPTIGNNPHNFLQGLSDFWVRFFADYDELKALYHGVEISLAQVYLDFLSSFLNISLLEMPIFNTEYFKLVTLREDEVVYAEGLNPADTRYVVAMPGDVAVADILQNKVLDPTAVLETTLDYDQDNTNYQFSFRNDPSGRSGLVVSETTTGSLLTYGTGLFTRLYTVNIEETPFASARVGQWVQILGSGSGNNSVFPIKEVIDPQTVLIGGTVTLPEVNNGGLVVRLFEVEFTAEPGFANRTVKATVGGTFDDTTYRGSTLMQSWYFDTPRGRSIRKGDIIRVLGAADPLVKDALPSIPADFPVTVVRHDKLYFGATTALLKDVEDVRYVLLRQSANSAIPEEFINFVRTGTPKPTLVLNNALLIRNGVDTVLQLPVGSPTTFAINTDPIPDKGRYVTLTDCGDITWTAQLAADGTLTRFGGVMETPLAVAVEGATVEILTSAYGQTGLYTLVTIDSETVGHIEGTFVPETVSIKLIGVKNNGTYRIKRVIDNRNAVLDLPASCPDLENTMIGWQIHDGYRVTLVHNRIVYTSLTLHGVVGNNYNGGYHAVKENEEYSVNYESGEITQIGRFAGQWGIDPIEMTNVGYDWLRELCAEQTTGALTTTPTTLLVREVAMWAPDAKVDKYHLYNNYGQYIGRFQPSSETYRSFIRGIFQLYILGPALRHIESALNVLAGFPVARDDGEYLLSYDAISDPAWKKITTQRIDGTKYTYRFDAHAAIRADIVAWTPTQPQLTFEAFEPFTTMFLITDYVQDPVWWESIVIPQPLLPEETSERRTTLPILYMNTVGALDGPRIGDPGLFVGADDEGVVPSWAVDLQFAEAIAGHASDSINAGTQIIHLENGHFSGGHLGHFVRIRHSVYNNRDFEIAGVIDSKNVLTLERPTANETGPFTSGTDGRYYRDATPAKRRKMANVLMDLFFKSHMFFVSFDPNLTQIITPDFVEDLRELIIVAKPGYALAYIEPASNFYDTLRLTESSVRISVTWDETDCVTFGNSLFIDSSTWALGKVFRPGTIVSAPLLVADGIHVPVPVTLVPYLAGIHVTPPVGTVGFYGEPRDYTLNRYTGVLTPLTVWPVGTYTVDYRPLIVNPSSSKNPALGDTDFLIGGLNPIADQAQTEHYKGGVLAVEGAYVTFTAAEAMFLAGLHEGNRISIAHPTGILPFGILAVLSPTKVVVDNPLLTPATNLLWSFTSREPRDGRLFLEGGVWHFRTPSSLFKHWHKDQHVLIWDATLSSGLNNGYWPIVDIIAPYEVILAGTHVVESNLHWRLTSGGNLGVVEQPLQIRVY